MNSWGPNQSLDREKKSKKSDLNTRASVKSRELISNNSGDGYENVTFKNVTRAYSISFIVKCWQLFLELDFKGLYQSSGKEKESSCPPQNMKLGTEVSRRGRAVTAAVTERNGE